MGLLSNEMLFGASSSGNIKEIFNDTLKTSANSVSFIIPSGYSMIEMFVLPKSTIESASVLTVTFNNDTNTNYSRQEFYAYNSIPQNNNYTGQTSLNISDIVSANSQGYRNILHLIVSNKIPSSWKAGKFEIMRGATIQKDSFLWNNSSEINKITLACSDINILMDANTKVIIKGYK